MMTRREYGAPMQRAGGRERADPQQGWGLSPHFSENFKKVIYD